MTESLRDRIKRHEGKRSTVYFDSLGVPTIGIGRNLKDPGLTDIEIDYLFENDLRRARASANRFEVYQYLSPARQDVITEMCFQLGYGGVSKFKRFLTAALQCKWQEAHDEMLDSKWHEQTPHRAEELARIFRDG